MRTVEVPVEALTHNSFRRFGQIIGELDEPPAWRRPRLTSWRMRFEMEGHPDLKCIHYMFQERKFTMMERHFSHTESRVPLGGGQAVMVVAASEHPLDPKSLPEPEDVRAFLLDGSVGIMLARGTWHSLDCYPARPPHTAFAFISEKESQAEIEVEGGDPFAARLTQVIDFADRDIRFEVTDPNGLLGVG